MVTVSGIDRRFSKFKEFGVTNIFDVLSLPKTSGYIFEMLLIAKSKSNKRS